MKKIRPSSWMPLLDKPCSCQKLNPTGQVPTPSQWPWNRSQTAAPELYLNWAWGHFLACETNTISISNMSTQRSSSQYLSNTLQYIPKIPYILSQVILSDYHTPSPSSFFQVGRYHAVQLRCRMPALLYLGCGKIQKKGTGTTSLLQKNPINVQCRRRKNQ